MTRHVSGARPILMGEAALIAAGVEGEKAEGGDALLL